MEIIFELLIALLQLVAEMLLQIVAELLAELGLRSVGEPFRRPQPVHPALAAIGYAILGAIAGGISLWLFPAFFIAAKWLQLANLVVTPLVAGATMAAFGAWRRRRNEELIRLDRFAYGFLFALAMALVRFVWARQAG